MNVELAVLADAANISTEGRLNLLGVFQTLYATATPCVVPQTYVVLLLRADLGEKGQDYSIVIRLVNAEGREMSRSPEIVFQFDRNSTAPNAEMPVIMRLFNFAYPEYGYYEFHVHVNGQKKRTIKFGG